MKKVVLALMLMTPPAVAQIPNLAPAPPVDRVGDPVMFADREDCER
jgi:hypothetical protein